MNAFENLLTRRSIRQYKQEPIPEEVLNKILEAGTYAPTGMNKQAPIIIAVTNREMRDRLSKMNAAIMGVDSDPFYGAPVVLVVLANKEVRTAVYDGSLVMGNLMLAAHELGVGSCWIQNRMRETPTGQKTEDYLRELLAFPADRHPEAILSMGIPAEFPAPKKLSDLDMTKVHSEKY